jgi:TPR repeat protein
LEVRLRPFLIAGALSLATAAAGHAVAQEPARLAQRWTPLTGILSPEGESQEGAPAKAPPPDPAPPVTTNALPPKPGPTASAVQTARLSVKATLSAVAIDGQPPGSLGVRTTSVDTDLAGALRFGAERGALVTDVSQPGAGALRVGDVILKLDGREIAGADTLADVLRGFNPGQEVTLDIWRAGDGAADLKRLLVAQSDEGDVGASASLGRLLSLGLALGPRNPTEAAGYYLRAAEVGHLASMTRYGLFAKDGIGIPKDEALAAKWFLEAANGGQEAAMTNLGTLYETGRGVKQDYAEAARWYARAVEKGHVFAMHKLALLYENGRGVAKDDQEAVKLLRQASDGGLSEATSWLAEKYELGRGIPKDELEANKLNVKAAEQVRRSAELGNAVATFNLGILYRIGKGVKRSDTEAAYWVVRSLKLGDKYLVSELMRNPNVLSLVDRKWLQEVLRDEGAYKGPINGTFTTDVRTAMESLASRA